jgi:hypothetical protein
MDAHRGERPEPHVVFGVPYVGCQTRYMVSDESVSSTRVKEVAIG